MRNEELLKGQSVSHDSANKHVTGLAQYTDDISEPLNTLYGAIGLSKKAHAIIKKIDLKKLESDQKFENQFSELLDDFDSVEEEAQHFELDKSKSIREQLIRKNEISQNLIQRFSEFLGSRIINQINAGRWETNIVLRPERLVKLNVKINLDNGEFKANFSTSNSVSRDILIEAIPKLKFNLENSGMNVASVNVDVFSSSDKNQGNQKNYILNQELNRTDRTDSEDEVMDTVSVQKINFSVDGIDIVI